MPSRVDSRRTVVSPSLQAGDAVATSLLDRIERLTGIAWDPEDSRPIPTPDVVMAAEKAKALSIEMWRSPDRITASIEGGLSLCYARGDRYADIEFTNPGEVLAVISDRISEPHVWTVDPSERGIREAIEKIQGFVDGGAS